MKKIMLLILLFCLVITEANAQVLPSLPNKRSAEVELSKAESFAVTVGAFNKAEYDSDKTLTRAELAGVIARLCRLYDDKQIADNWKSTAMQSDKNDVLLGEAEMSESVFFDVDKNTTCFNEIMLVVSHGYMKGVSADKFGADLKVSKQEAMSVFVDMLGYSAEAKRAGGYPKGYIFEAARLKITDGISKPYSDNASFSEISQIIYNTLDVNMYPGRYDYDRKESFMSRMLKMKKIKGVVTDNGITKITGKTELSKGNIRVGDGVFTTNEKSGNAEEYIGCEVELFYTEDDGILNARFICPTYAERKLEILPENVIDFSGNTLTYYDEGGKRCERRLGDVTYMIYNGEAKEIYGKDSFMFEFGDITISEIRGSRAEMICVNNYETCYVSGFDSEKGVIFNGLSKGSEDNSIDINNYDYVIVIDADGNETDMESITIGSVVDILRAENVLKIYLSGTVHEKFEITSIGAKNKHMTVSNGTVLYEISDACDKMTHKPELKIGNICTLYINGFGKAVYITDVEMQNSKYGYFVRSGMEETLNRRLRVKIFESTGKFEQLVCAEKVSVVTSTGETKTVSDSKLYTDYLSSGPTVLKYRLNRDGEISGIDLPTSDLSMECGLYKIFESEYNLPGVMSRFDSGDVPYNSVWGFGSGAAFVDADTVIIKIPNDKTKEELFSVIETGEIGKYAYWPVAAYVSDKKSLFADIVIIKPKNETDAVESGTERTLLIVDQIGNMVQGEDVIKYASGTLINNANKVSEAVLYSASDSNSGGGEPCSYFENIPDVPKSETSGTVNRYNVKRGDIIRCTVNKQGFVTMAELVFRPDAHNPEFSHGALGHLMGTTGFFSTSDKRSNPYQISSLTGVIGVFSGYPHWNVNLRVSYGWVYRCENGVVQMTTQDLSTGDFDPDGMGGKYIIDAFKMNNSYTAAVKYTKDGELKSCGSFKQGDIRSYEDAGSSCSRILAFNVSGTFPYIVIINSAD